MSSQRQQRVLYLAPSCAKKYQEEASQACTATLTVCPELKETALDLSELNLCVCDAHCRTLSSSRAMRVQQRTPHRIRQCPQDQSYSQRGSKTLRALWSMLGASSG